MDKLQYSIDDKTIAELLGVQNFTTSESAILELVKNAYDADAKNLLIEINKDKIEILDDGKGMDENDIRKNWMYVGKSDKGYKNEEGDRVLAGSKGVGRFALAKLGNKAIIYTKKIDSNGFKWSTNWEESYIEKNNSITTKGTKIVITELREKWNDTKIKNLTNFISRTYNDSSMNIKINDIEINPYFKKAKVGFNCLTSINIKYNASNMNLNIKIKSDEFSDEAKKYCKNYDINFHETNKNIFDEFFIKEYTKEEREELKEYLVNLGNFSAEFYFNSNPPTSVDVKKFLYKHSRLPEKMESGVVLYRNAFSISSFDGEKDWLTFGKRSRKSPAAASHATGKWRVRENQISGKVEIDKKKNRELKDLANRQGLEENRYYDLFVDIILLGIDEFEDYRQSIIRYICTDKEEYSYSVIDKILANKNKKIELSPIETKKFEEEIKFLKDEKQSNEKQYKYDTRILNTLSTIGLKASAKAHEMKNDKDLIFQTTEYIIDALKEYDMWEILNSPEHTKIKSKNIPVLLDDCNEVFKEMNSFIEIMLSNIEKKKFKPIEQNIKDIINVILDSWKQDYSWVNFKLNISDDIVFFISEDILEVIFDNLILNSIQQNDFYDTLNIKIKAIIKNNFIDFEYSDNGKGLAPKYLNNPKKILDPLETTRKNGHGLGMWIVNNTIKSSGGLIKEIKGAEGFKISFSIGDKYYAYKCS